MLLSKLTASPKDVNFPGKLTDKIKGSTEVDLWNSVDLVIASAQYREIPRKKFPKFR
jgi:hypothetical protein